MPAGTYTLSIRAVNSAGTSTASTPVTLTFPGSCSGAPLAPANFLAYRLGRRIFVVWDPADSGAATASYALNVTGSFVGSFPTPGRSLSGAVAPGTYHISVTALNGCGASTATAAQTVGVR